MNVCTADHDHSFIPKPPYGAVDSKGTFEPKGADLQIERVNASEGSNIYDAATWQIALALAAHHNLKLFDNSSSQDKNYKKQTLADMVDNQNLLLKVGYDGEAPEDPPQRGGTVMGPPKNVIKEGSNRATTKTAYGKSTFLYNGKQVFNFHQAFHFRMIPRAWLADDPFAKPEGKNDKSPNFFYDKYVKIEGKVPSEYEGKISWMDWKPITGENAWAFYVGPLQAEYILSRKDGGRLSLGRMAIQNALPLLDTLSYMQSITGGIYYAPQGSLGNVDDQEVHRYEVSVENNASVLAGLHIFEKLLEQIRSTRTLSAADDAKIKAATCRIDSLIYGGKTADNRTTPGLLNFFKNSAWSAEKGIFIQGGYADDPKNPGKPWVPKPMSGPNKDDWAVDVTTWGIAVIGPQKLDEWKGFGAAYNAWKSVRTWGSYKSNGELWGVGFSDKDNGGNGLIMSAEWTAGAINVVRMLIHHYEGLSAKNPNIANLRVYVRDLRSDEAAMSKHLINLRTDKYPDIQAFGSPRTLFRAMVPIDSSKYLGYLYASKRYFIPFGWFANPLPSTTSTAWAVMLHYQFNPFTWGGGYGPNEFKTAEQQQVPCGTSSHSPKKVKVKPEVRDAVNVVVSWCGKAYDKCQGGDWHELLNMANPPNFGAPLSEMSVSDETMKSLSVSFRKHGTGWYGACHLDLNQSNPKVKDLMQGRAVLHAMWAAPNGSGNCDVKAN